eukprot:gene6697-8283_t
MRLKIVISIILVLISILSHSISAETDYAISPVSLLLPYSTSKYRKPFKLEANKGCFEWINTNPDLVDITPIYESPAGSGCNVPSSSSSSSDNKQSQQTSQQAQQQQQTLDSLSLWDSTYTQPKKCSSSVLVTVRSSGIAERNSAFIYAEEQTTGKRLQCEVFVDKISSIVIETTTKTMYKDDLEELHVRAYDSVGNVFSSIVGLEFEWSIAAGNIIQIVPFRGFPLDDVALKMEQEGLQTSFVLVQGVDTGRTQVTTRLTDSNYKDIHHSTTISILEPLQLNPSYLLYTIPGTQIQYQLLTKKRNVVENIPLPNSNYIWSSSNSKVGIVDNSGLFMALDLGRTDLKVQHRNMSDNKVQAFITVVTPSYLAIKIEPIKAVGPVVDWNLIENRNYILIVELYDASGHKIYSSDITFDIDIPTEYFEPIPSNEIPQPKRSDTFYLKAIKQGIANIKASLVKVYDLKIKSYTQLITPISVEQKVTIHPQITLLPPVVYLPYLPMFKQSYTLKPKGGSGEYNWFSNNTMVVSVDSTGTIHTQSQQQPGQTEIIVVDKKNPHNRDTARAIVLKPNEIIIHRTTVEVEVGKSISLSTKLLSTQLPKGLHFDACNLPDQDWKIEDSKIFQLVPSTNKSSDDNNNNNSNNSDDIDKCSTKEFLALREGSTIVTAEYMGMKAQVRIFAFPPLKVNRDEVLVSLGSSAQLSFTGGPDPWYLEPKSFYQTVLPDSHVDSVSIDQSATQTNSYTVTCLKHVGPVIITITSGNRPTKTNPFPAAPTTRVLYSCQPPKSIQIAPEEEEKSDSESTSTENVPDQCLDSIYSISRDKKQKGEIGTYKIRNNREIPFLAKIFDESGKLFTNASSLLLSWTTSDADKAKWLSDANDHDINSKLKLFDQEGKVTITATITGYNQDLLKKHKIQSMAPSLDSSKLKGSLELHLLSGVKLSPERATLYLNDKNSLRIEAIGGSRNFAFSSNNTKIAHLSYQPNTAFATVSPLHPGFIRIDVRDICIGTTTQQQKQTPPSIIQVSEAVRIELEVRDMVQIGDTIPMKVRVFSVNGDEFDESQYQYMSIVPHNDNPSVLSVTPSLENPQTFKLRGLDQGLVTMTVSIVNPKTAYSTTSKTLQIQVFPPFRVSPHTLHLVPGGHFQIQWSGGAPTRQDVSFESSDPSVTALGKDIIGELVAVKVGEATIRAFAHITDPITGAKSIIGEDKLVVYVKNMTGIRLHSSINKLLVGNEAKLRIVGASGETPFTYGTVDLFFKWECVDTNVATLLPIYEKANTTVESEGAFSVRVLGKNPGITTITAWAYSGSDKTTHLFQSASLQITVLPTLPIQTTSLLLPLNTPSSFIISNGLDKAGIEFHTLLDSNGGSTCKEIIDISDNKIVSLDKIGTCYVSATRDGRVDASKLLKVNSKPFSHLELLPVNPSSTVIPIGGSMTFSVLLRDDIGELFTEYGSSASFTTEVSNSGIISASVEANSTSTVVSVKGIRAGLVTLRVLIKDMPHLDDYVKIFVGQLIDPALPVLHVGAKLQFNIATQQLTQRGYSLPSPNEKVWSSGDLNIISIDSVSGKSITHSPGRTTVNYIRNPSSQTQVQVSKIAKIQVNFGDQVINNPNEKYSYPLQFFNSDHQELSLSPTIHQNILGVCSIQELDFAKAHFERTTVKGVETYRCVVQPTGVPTSTVDKITLHVQVTDSERTYSYDQVFSVPFESSFSILNAKTKIGLTPKQRTYTLNIQSSKIIFVESSDPSLLSVQQIPSTTTSDSTTTTRNTYKYLIQPMSSSTVFNNVPIYISSTSDGKNKQTIFVSYSTDPSSSYTGGEGYPTSFLSYNYLYTCLFGVLFIFIGIILSKKYNQKPRTIISSGNQDPSSSQSSFTGSTITSPYRTPPPQSFMSPGRNSMYGTNSSFGNSIYLNESRYR